MDLKQLEYFRHVAELGSFTRAASFLSVVQPALSRQVRQLEVELGQNLFDRNGRGVVLTRAGTRLLEHTRGILMQVGRARQELEDQRNGDSGHFVLGLPPSLGRSVTVPLVKAFGRLLPNARLATVEGLSAYMLEWLHVGRVDCALVYNAPAVAQSGSPAPARRSAVSHCAARGQAGAQGAQVHHPGGTGRLSAHHPEPAALHPHVGGKCAGRRRPQDPRGARNRVHSRGHRSGTSGPRLRRAAAERGQSTPWRDAVLVKPILAPTLKTSLSLATSAQRPKSPLIRKAIDVIRDIVRREICSAEAPS